MKNNNLINKSMRTLCVLIFITLNLMLVSGAKWISLDGSSGEVRVNDSNTLRGFNEATWNMWINQQESINYSGIIGKYAPRTGQREYIIRTSNTDGISVILSGDGSNVGSYSSASTRKCGIRGNNQWTMITITYNGSIITYYRNGIKCDQDKTLVNYLYSSPSPVRLGGGNGVFFSGEIDEFTIYNTSLDISQIKRLYSESQYGSDLGQSIPVIVYHKIDDGLSETIKVTPTQFKQQMDYLKREGFNTITLRDYYNWREGNYNMPKKAIIIVFDDGFKSVITNAKPIMDQYGFVGSIATVTRYASFTSPNSGYMNWLDIQNLNSKGWSIESHGITHGHMLKLNESQFRYELLSSKQTIAGMTKIVPSSFVFPFHESNITYTDICGEYYSLCWTQGSLNPTYDFKSTLGDKYLSLRRINVVNITALKDFSDFLMRDTNKAGELYMNEGFGSSTFDASGNNNVGKLLGGASWSDISKDYCTDSDGGQNYYLKGIADDRINSIGSFYEDRCLLLNQTGPASWQYVKVRECTGTLCSLQEGYCSDGKSSNVAFNCLLGCSNGACIEQISTLSFLASSDKVELNELVDNLIDSDKGKPYIKIQPDKVVWPDNMDIEGEYYATHDPIKIEKEKEDKNKGDQPDKNKKNKKNKNKTKE